MFCGREWKSLERTWGPFLGKRSQGVEERNWLRRLEVYSLLESKPPSLDFKSGAPDWRAGEQGP